MHGSRFSSKVPRLVGAGALATIGFAAFLAATPAAAAILQQVNISGDVALSDFVEVPAGDPVPRTVSVELSEPDARFSASIDPFGNVGLSGALFRSGAFTVSATITNDEFFNPFGFPVRASGKVIVDGGFLRVLGPKDAKVSLRILTTGNGDGFVSIVGLEMDSDFGTATLIEEFTPLNLTRPDQPVGNEIVIEPTVIDIDFGTLDPFEVLDVSYQALVEIETSGPTEIAEFAFSDPLSLSFESLTFTPIDSQIAMPSPPSALLLLGAFAGMVLGLRRRRS